MLERALILIYSDKRCRIFCRLVSAQQKRVFRLIFSNDFLRALLENRLRVPYGVPTKKVENKNSLPFLLSPKEIANPNGVRSTSVGRQPFCRKATFPLSGELPLWCTTKTQIEFISVWVFVLL